VFPTVVGLLIIAPLLVQIIPRYDKWQPALLPFALISINTIFAASTTQLTNMLNATGRIKTTFKLMVMWTVLTWLFVPYLAKQHGVNGAAVGYALVGASSVVAIYIVYKIVKFSLYRSIFVPAIASIAMGILLLLVRGLLDVSLSSVWLICGLGAVSYMLVMYILVGPSIIADAKKGFKAIFTKT
jgi:O-antigen/teichoic acid export membrane protein